MRIVLASGSPRRRELLAKITKEYEVITADVDERTIEEGLFENFKKSGDGNMLAFAESLCKKLSLEKAKAVFEKLGKPEGVLVIGADTSVALDDEILGKPKDRADAVRMLRKQSTKPQHVITGVSFITSEKSISFSETSLVIFNKLDDAQEARIELYVDTDEPYDKAGGYGIQALGDRLVDHYEGDFNNIIGFPVERVKEELEKFL